MNKAVSQNEVERLFIEFLEREGIAPASSSAIRADGRLRRYNVAGDTEKKRTGAYVLHADGWPAGWAMDWRRGGEKSKWKMTQEDLPQWTDAEKEKYAEQMEARIRTNGAYYPFLVCELDGQIVGYAYAFRRFEEQSLDWSVFISTYTSIEGKGISRALIEALEEILRAMGVVNIYSIAAHNSKSQYFHLARGFIEAGRLREAVYKGGKWRDLAYYQKSIALHDTDPAPVQAVGELDQARLAQMIKRAEQAIRA